MSEILKAIGGDGLALLLAFAASIWAALERRRLIRKIEELLERLAR